MLEGDDVTSVIIFTQSYRVTGQVALARQNRRLTDYMLEAKEFIAVIKAEVTDHAGRLVLSAPFLNVQRAHVEVVAPTKGAKLGVLGVATGSRVMGSGIERSSVSEDQTAVNIRESEEVGAR